MFYNVVPFLLSEPSYNNPKDNPQVTFPRVFPATGTGRHFASSVSRLGNLLVGGWELSGIYTAQTGMFLTSFWSGDDPVGIFYTDSSTPASVTLRPNALRDPKSGQRAAVN